jgi:hypothetical protein
MVNDSRLCLRFLFGGPEDMAVMVVNFAALVANKVEYINTPTRRFYIL